MDKTIVIIIVVIILAAGGFWAWQSGIFSKVPPISVLPTPNPGGIILFYSPDCPHCIAVEDFIKSNNIDQKIKITRLEVPFGTKTGTDLVANAELAIQLGQSCKLDVTSGISIPFLYDPSTSSGQAGKCYIGQVDVPAFLKTAAGIK